MKTVVIILLGLCGVIAALLLVSGNWPAAIGLIAVALLAVVAAQTEALVHTMREVRDELRRHSNATVGCPKCKGRIVLTDGRGTCDACGQAVKA
jgi:membrane protein implicated in regulation of membrane protease activity